MKREEINIRDPFVLVDEGKYYLYGTRSETAWTDAEGFDVYVSEDLENWTPAKEIFRRTPDFWATSNFWAPECIRIDESYYMAATFGGSTRKKGIQILKAASAEGPFVPLTKYPVTPAEWNCLDGTFYHEKNGAVWLVFSHSVPEEPRGAICAAPLNTSMTKFTSKPKILFYMATVSWAKPIPFAKAEFGVDGDAFFSDGPYLFTAGDGKLCMLFSSWSHHGYAMGIATSSDGTLTGQWLFSEVPILDGGGHGMIFSDKNGELLLTYHHPNEPKTEHPVFEPLKKYL